MVKYYFKILLFIIAFLLYDKLFLVIANRSAEVEVDRRLEHVIEGKIDKDIVIIGSSRGARGIIASQIEDETGYTTYNLCYPGSNVVFHEFILRTLLKFNNEPRLVLLVVDDDIEFKYDSTVVFRKDRLYPLIKYPYVWKKLSAIDDQSFFFQRYLILSRLNKYNFDIRQKKFTPLDTIKKCGSMPLSWYANERDRYFRMEEKDYEQENEVIEYITAYQSILETCKINNINLVVVFPPLLRNHSQSFEQRIRELGDEKIDYYIYNFENPVYSYKKYYHGGGHLIFSGAQIFTDEISDYISETYTFK